jgi:subtilase family serine protease
MYIMRYSTLRTSLLFIIIALSIPVGSAIYAWEGIPVEPVIVGEMNGEVLFFGTYGLDEPPIDLRFTLPSKPVFARIYAGVWGGTEQYTGWADITVNNIQKARFQLEGERDRNRDVYAVSHGSYWCAYDGTDLLRSGQNLVSVSTSRGETGNRLDGRVYGLIVIAGVGDPASGRVQYWVAEGNENLHGEGWAGSNPTWKDSSTTVFEGSDLTGLQEAELFVTLIASNAGQPDYLLINGHDLGIEGSGGTRDIGNERSFSATGEEGIPSRYMDAERFDVTGYVRGVNEITFERGRDLDFDGQIATTGSLIEGEDYIHPVIAVLTLKKDAGPALPDLAVTAVKTTNAYAGETATVTADIRNYGGLPDGPVKIIFSADGTQFAEETVTLSYDGQTSVSLPWKPASGTIALSVTAEVAGDRNPGNNEVVREITIGTPPDLAVMIHNPVRSGAGTAVPAEASPVPAVLGIAAIFFALLLFRFRSGEMIAGVLVAALVISSLGIMIPVASADGGYVAYDLPVTIRNYGGSDAPAFEVAVYLDGERAAVMRVAEGIPAGSQHQVTIPIYTTPGRHTVRVVADERNILKERNIADNSMEMTYVFS